MLTSAYTPEPTMDDFQAWLASFRAAMVAIRLGRVAEGRRRPTPWVDSSTA